MLLNIKFILAVHLVKNECLVAIKVIIFTFAFHPAKDERVSPSVSVIIFTFKVHPIEDVHLSLKMILNNF